MSRNSSIPRSFPALLSFLILPLLIVACAEVRLNTIPPPPPTPKLRVFLLPVSNPPPQLSWPTPHEEWARYQIMSVRKLWQGTGIYEVATREDFAQVAGTKSFSHGELSGRDWRLLRELGRALHADYAMMMERSIFGPPPVKYFETVLINVETGKRFRVASRLPFSSSPQEELRQMEVIAYNEMFRDAGNDILAVAIRKGRLASPGFPAGQPAMPEKSAAQISSGPIPKTTETIPAQPTLSSVPPSGGKPAASQEFSREVDYARILSMETAIRGREKLAVYALDTPAPYRVMSLILTEALRQELFSLGIFDLVNREDMARVSEEMAFQQTGFVDEKEAVKAGKGLAARQIVMGQFGTLGKTSILQVKRVDVETQRSLGFGHLKCEIGQEEELLQKMPDLAKELSRNR